MIKVGNLTSDAFQEHIILFEESEVILDMRFLSVTENWIFDVKYKDFSLFGVKFAVRTLHMEAANQPFDFVVVDETGAGLDPFKLNDWEDGRCSLYMLEAADMEELRGVAVPI